MSFLGTSGPILIRDDPEYQVGVGWVRVREYEGSFSEIMGLFGQLRTAGYQIRTSSNPPIWRLTATKQAKSETEDQEFYDRFTLSTETVEKDIFLIPAVEDEVLFFVGQGGEGQEYRHEIEEAVETGNEANLQIALPIVDFPVAWKVYRELTRGVEGPEDEYIALKRDRVVGINYVPKLAIPAGNKPKIYTTAQLQSTFNIPNLIGIEWPDATPPPTPIAGTMWAWKSRRREVQYIEGQRAHVTEDWAWAQWSTYLYEPA